MAAGLYPLRKLQVGLEATPGTLVAATKKLVGRAGYTPMQERDYDQYPRGVFLPDLDGGVIMQKGSRLQWETDLTYEEGLYPLLCGILNDAVPGGVGPYTWDFNRNWALAPSLKTATFEYVIDDGATKQYEREFGYAFCRQFTISGRAGPEPVRISSEWVGRAEQASTMTPALSPITARKVIPGELFKFYVDGTWGTLGTTQKTGLLRSWSLAVTPGVEPDFTVDGRTDLDHTQLRYLMGTAVLSLTMRHDANGKTEVDAWRATTERAVRLIGTDGTKIFQADIAGFYRGEPSFDEEDGTENVTLELHADYEAAGAQALDFRITNQVSVQP